MLRKEFIQIFRDPRMRMIIIVVPMIQLFVFAYAATTDVVNIPAAVMDRDNTPASRELVSRFLSSGHFKVREYVSDEERVTDLLDRGAVSLVIRINSGFERKLKSGRTPQVQVLVDGTDSNTGGIVLQYGARIVAEYSRKVAEENARTIGAPGGTIPGVTLLSRAWFNPNLKSRIYFIPGLMTILVTLISLLLTGMAVVREKEMGTMEQVIVTPITRMEFILGKTLPFAIIGYLDMAIVTLVAMLWFKLPLRGSPLLIALGLFCYLLCTISIGLFISTVSETQQQALMSTFLFMFPATLLSGFMFPIENMPEPVQWLTCINPMRYYLAILRAEFLKGIGIEYLWREYISLVVLGCIMMTVTLLRFKKRMM